MYTNNYCRIIETEESDRFYKDIINLGESSVQREGMIGDDNFGHHKNHVKRKSIISFLDHENIKETLSKYINFANKEQGWNYKLKEFEPLQYTSYSDGGHYDWHIDSHPKPYQNNGYVRKLSFTLCLNEGYEGGLFEMSVPGPIREKDKHYVVGEEWKIGTMIVFPSFLWHKVRPVTKGGRKVLVGWVVGPQWS